MRATLAAIAAALLLLASSATVLADPPAYFLMASAPMGGGKLPWLRCTFRGSWSTNVEALPAPEPGQMWFIGFHQVQVERGFQLITVPAPIADAYVCELNAADNP